MSRKFLLLGDSLFRCGMMCLSLLGGSMVISLFVMLVWLGMLFS